LSVAALTGPVTTKSRARFCLDVRTVPSDVASRDTLRAAI
jgi:hypothetical protein